MCGILACLYCNFDCNDQKNRFDLINRAIKLRHRGPDSSGIWIKNNMALLHERLTIVGDNSGKQPLVDKENNIALTVNGEIFNHYSLKAKINNNDEFLTNSDCEVILHGYKLFGYNIIEELDGQFSFVLVDTTKNSFFVGRDPIGITPLYYGHDKTGALWFASEMKAIIDIVETIKEFPPGHYMIGLSNINYELCRYYNPIWNYEHYFPLNNPANYSKIYYTLFDAVKKRINHCETEWGVLLSGGLDSSLVAGIAKILLGNRNLNTFSIGLADSPDLTAAKQVANHIKSNHHEFTFTFEEGLDAIDQVIYHLETYDITTIRASTPMYLLSRKIKALGVKMILSGEGADELHGGYSYFHYAPSAQEFQSETRRKVMDLHLYDCLRANKATAAWGLEAVFPFLDNDYINLIMTTNAEDKMCNGDKIEKYILRYAFGNAINCSINNTIIPLSILWRQKEQFSDGVGYSWIDKLKNFTNNYISDIDFKNAKYKFEINTPLTKEAYFYRSIFHKHFGSINQSAAICVPNAPSFACSSETAIKWNKQWNEINFDPSGRSVDVHKYHF